MIIEWTYGTYAQLQRYFGLGYIGTESVVFAPLLVTQIINLNSKITRKVSLNNKVTRSISLNSRITREINLNSKIP